ncbi:MAG: rhodanese-like domain-containing protein [Gaiellales bacterium]|nr:MAG: rhodanese-like domain-containing protein [Gaiellales bacterium]
MDAWMIVIAGLAGGTLLSRYYGKLKLRRAGVVEVNVPEAERLVSDDGALVVDVRELGEYREGRIPQARHVPLSEMRQRMRDLERDRPIVVSCRSGRRSAYAGIYLARNGFSHVYNLKGGMNAWTRANRQIER